MNDREIQAIIDRVMREVGSGAPPAAAAPPPATRPDDRQPAPPAAAPPKGDFGVYPTLDEAATAARAAFQRLNALPLAIRRDMVAHMRQAGWTVSRFAERC